MQHVDLVIDNLPLNYDVGRLKMRLSILTNNCGGRVTNINNAQGIATVRFSSLDFATRFVFISFYKLILP